MISREELAYRQRVLTETERWGRKMPHRLRSILLLAMPEAVVSTIIESPSPETGGIPRLRETAMIPSINLLRQNINVRETRELVSSAVRWFWQKHGCLPSSVTLNPMRCLAIDRPDFFQVDGLEDLGCYGCYTVSIEADSRLSSDVVRLIRSEDAFSEEVAQLTHMPRLVGNIENYYL